MELFGFTEAETIPYIGILSVVVIVLARNYKRGYLQFWSPLTIMSIVFAYYCLLGPYQAVASNMTTDRLMNMRPFYESAFWGALLSLVSCIIGFSMNRKSPIIGAHRIYKDEWLSLYGRKLFVIGFVLFSVSIGGNVARLINPLDAEVAQQIEGSFVNYLNLALNFVIPAVTLLFIYFIKTKKGLLWFVVTLLVSIALFTSLGFRYRIVLLLGSMAVSYYLVVNRRPNLIFLVLSIGLFIIVMGFIEVTRQYGSGLKLGKLDSDSKRSFYESGIKEALIFQTSGAVIDIVPQRQPYVGFEPIIQTVIFPIPRVLFPQKNSAGYLFSTLDEIYGEKLSTGAAFLMFGEHYLAFGWVGIFVGGFLIGWFYKKLWIWFLSNRNNPLIVVTYATSVVYLYVIISRGYLPQVTMLFFFSVYPLFYIIRRVKNQHYQRVKNA